MIDYLLGGSLQFSPGAFVRDRLIAEGGSLKEWDKIIGRDPSPSKDNDADVATNQDTNNNELSGDQFPYDPNHNPRGITTGPAAATTTSQD
eukprot:CAMPEP_0201645784 /NCGR_PEP_ID=MMETSP0493-20130528/32764_1 /ASSEMBLY_ACC=CAM_ASM_000838 /TAXON_ID=420259 /ORGANISM="Thalassiosira gravida, Strain GMp14c1" /LENGTH=90 /DNA_ID=CAMNT_0048120803 /DNA_START=847 /DNA_END=1116 /DNA_ORIENTATION=+